MAHCEYYFEILFYVTFAFIKEKKSIIKKNYSKYDWKNILNNVKIANVK